MSARVAIVGGGLMGLAVAHALQQEGIEVVVFERSQQLGGLVGSFDLDGFPVDRFYHVVLPTDERVRSLAESVGLHDTFTFRPVQVGFYDSRRLFSMSSLREFLTFPLLSPIERVRLARFVVGCRRIADPAALDALPLEAWLRDRSGDGVVERLWAPLLDSKFDGRFDDLPATYMWARTRRMAGTRDAAGREVMGWPAGGYQRIVDRLAGAISERGGEIHAGTNVDCIAGDRAGVVGLVVDGRLQQFDHVLSTLLPPQNRGLVDGDLAAALPRDRCRYLGVVCVILRTARSVSPYYTLNITDRRIPLTTVVETTHVVDPTHVGGHLVYAAKYVQPNHPDLVRPEREVAAEYVAHVRTMFPDLVDDDVLAVSVQRAPMVEPVHTMGGAQNLPAMSPVPGLTLASTVHVYPDVVNGQAVLGVAQRATEQVLTGLAQSGRERGTEGIELESQTTTCIGAMTAAE
jgi:protoporphyrinogen oxidase